MGLGKIIVYGLAIFGAYQIYSWTTSNKEIKPQEPTTIEAPAPNENYRRGKDIGEGVWDFFEGFSGSISDKLKTKADKYKPEINILKKDTEQYADQLNKLKTNYLDSIIK
ncbi:hypothetical protein HOC35_07310 [Candidatus Woesearchaeota archaeon]|nr:hypothetical protein [Candidatus Woesearchaeota archaeon]